MKLFKTHTFTWQQMAGVKVTLISFGILVALYYPDFFRSLSTLWWVIAVAGTIYFLMRLAKDK